MEFVSNKFKQEKTGKRINVNDLLDYIKQNCSEIEDVDCIDLNELKNQIPTKKLISQLKFQEIEKITKISNKMDKFFDISNNVFLHVGTMKNTSKCNDSLVSLLYSICVCLISNFIIGDEKYQNKFIVDLFDKMKQQYKDIFREHNYKKYGWKQKNNLIEEMLMNIFIDDNDLIKMYIYLSDYFCINIFILDLTKDNLYFGGDDYIPYKRTIFLLKYENSMFEPMNSEKTKVFSIDDNIIKKIRINKEFINVYTDVIGKTTFEESIEELFNETNTQTKTIENDNKSEIPIDTMNAYYENCSDTECDNTQKKTTKSPTKKGKVSEENKYDIKNITLKMKLNELQTIAKDLNITISKKTKQMLLDEITKKLIK